MLYDHNDDHHALLHSATWNDAKSICVRQKSTLATVHSLDENEALFNFLVNASLDSAWIGMNDKGIFRGQQWVDGSAVNFVRWDSKQPDSNLGQQACTVMASNGYWRDNDCAMVRNYICKASIGKCICLSFLVQISVLIELGLQITQPMICIIMRKRALYELIDLYTVTDLRNRLKNMASEGGFTLGE